MIRQSILLFQCRGIIFMYVIIQAVRVVNTKVCNLFAFKYVLCDIAIRVKHRS